MSEQSLPLISTKESWESAFGIRRATMVQTLNVNTVIIHLADVVDSWRIQDQSHSQDEWILDDFLLCRLFELMHDAIGLPMNAIRMILTQEELDKMEIDQECVSQIKLGCQLCREEASGIGTYRGNQLLLCADHMDKTQQ